MYDILQELLPWKLNFWQVGLLVMLCAFTERIIGKLFSWANHGKPKIGELHESFIEHHKEKTRIRNAPLSLAEVPRCYRYFRNVKLDTQDSKLIAYRLRKRHYDDYGQLGGKGVYFEGYYVSPDGFLFEYIYKHDGRLYNNRQTIIVRDSFYHNQGYYDKIDEIALEDFLKKGTIKCGSGSVVWA